MANVPDLLGDNSSPPPTTASGNVASDNIAAALSTPPSINVTPTTTTATEQPPAKGAWTNLMGGLVTSARDLATSSSATVASVNVNLQPFQNFTKSLSHNITGRSTLPDKTTASQVLMFRQLLHTKCRPGLRLSRGYEGTAAQMAVLHMPWWERGIEQSKKMVISYDNLITRLWLSGAIMPYEKGGYASTDTKALLSQPSDSEKRSAVDTLINERGLPPVPHQYWVDRLGFQQDDPVTDFRSGGVLSLAMLVHIVESCPAVHARFVPKQPTNTNGGAHSNEPEMSLEQIITEDASVLPFGITCINVTDMLAKFLMFSKSVDKMDALLSAKPFWKMFIDPNAMLILQEVSLDLLCDVCVEIGRERRLARLTNEVQKKEDKTFGNEGKVTVFDFSEIMERTEARVGDEVLGAGPRSVDELRAVARRVKSKYLLRIQSKEKYTIQKKSSPQKQVSSLLPTRESTKNVADAVMEGVGGLTTMFKTKSSTVSVEAGNSNESKPEPPPLGESSTVENEEVEISYIDTANEDQITDPNANKTEDALSEAFDLLDSLGGDFTSLSAGDIDDTDQELLDAMDVKLDPAAAFTIDDDMFKM